jgi:hypothetical protein
MRRGSSRIYWCNLDLPQHVSASHCHHQGVVVIKEATQVISVFWVYMDYDPSTTDHTGGIVIHIHPQYRYCLSSFWDIYDHLYDGTGLLKHVGVNLECVNKSCYYLDAFVGYFITISVCISIFKTCLKVFNTLQIGVCSLIYFTSCVVITLISVCT